ncbi:MAG: type II secretion system protein GspD [Planctomycetota bacterium]|jgi:hypothetical protein
MRKLALGLVLAFFVGCGGGGDSFFSTGKYGHGDLTIGESLRGIYKNIPGGKSLIRRMPALTLTDQIREIQEYSSSTQAGRVPNPAQDIRFMGFTSRRMSALDLITLQARFPEGEGPNGTTFKASNLTWNPGKYVFLHAEYEADVPINDSSKNLQYAFVWDRDGDASNNWVGQGIFDQDFFIGSDTWLQLVKLAGSSAQLTMSETDGTSVNTVQSAAAAFVHGNAAVYMLPYSEFSAARNLFPSIRTTAFDNIDGNFGQGNDDGWSADTAPVQPNLFIPSTPALARSAPRFEFNYRLVASSEDLLLKYSIPYSWQWPIEAQAALSDTAVEVDLTRDVLGRGGIPDWRSLYTPTTADGAFTPGIFSITMPPVDFCTYGRVPGEADIPFTAGDMGPMPVLGNVTFNTNVPAVDGTDSTQGELAGNLLDPSSVQALLEQLAADPGVQIVFEPQIRAVNGQGVSIIGHNWQANVADLNPVVRNQVEAIDSNVQVVDTGAALRLTPRLTLDDQISLSIGWDRAASVRAQDVTVDGEAMGARLPVIETTGLETTVLLESGETVVIGGLLPQSSSTIEPGIPFLQDIPVLGTLFSQKTYDRTDFLIILLTPHILDGDN